MKLSRFLTQRAEEFWWSGKPSPRRWSLPPRCCPARRCATTLIIKAIALDIEDFQSKAEQTAKSHGDGPANVKLDVAGELSDVAALGDESRP